MAAQRDPRVQDPLAVRGTSSADLGSTDAADIRFFEHGRDVTINLTSDERHLNTVTAELAQARSNSVRLQPRDGASRGAVVIDELDVIIGPPRPGGASIQVLKIIATDAEVTIRKLVVSDLGQASVRFEALGTAKLTTTRQGPVEVDIDPNASIIRHPGGELTVVGGATRPGARLRNATLGGFQRIEGVGQIRGLHYLEGPPLAWRVLAEAVLDPDAISVYIPHSVLPTRAVEVCGRRTRLRRIVNDTKSSTGSLRWAEMHEKLVVRSTPDPGLVADARWLTLQRRRGDPRSPRGLRFVYWLLTPLGYGLRIRGPLLSWATAVLAVAGYYCWDNDASVSFATLWTGVKLLWEIVLLPTSLLQLSASADNGVFEVSGTPLRTARLLVSAPFAALILALRAQMRFPHDD